MQWSSQHYIHQGLAQGADFDVLKNAVEQIENIILPPPHLPAILTLGHFAHRTKSSFGYLRKLVSRERREAYRHFKIRKRSGGSRVISVPEPTLMNIQRWITKYVLKPQPVSKCSFAFSPHSSILKCASRHTGARWLIKMDIRAFFGSVSEIQVYNVFRRLNYEPLISFELARLTTHAPFLSPRYESKRWLVHPHRRHISSYRTRHMGYLPQGAPTSPMLSNLVMREIDDEIEALAKGAGLRFTRYSDDITFSTAGEFDRKRALRIIARVTKILIRNGFHVNPRKTVIAPPGGRKVVLGLLVDGALPKLSREFRAILRQHIHYLELYGAANHAAKRQFDSIWGMHQHIRGLIDFANMVDEGFAQMMLKRFNAIEWPSTELT